MRFRRPALGWTLAVSAVLTVTLLIGALSGSALQRGGGGQASGVTRYEEHVPGEILIKFKKSAFPVHRVGVLAGLGATTTRRFLGSGEQLELGNGWTVAQAIETYRDHPAVEYVEPNYIVRLDALPDDPSLPDLYGLRNTGQTGGTPGADIDAALAWDVTTGRPEVIVGVVDTGIDYDHPDLAGNIWINPGEIPGNTIDDDGNGFVDDVRGWDFVNDDNDPMDDRGHGTHVSGTVGAVGDNGIGVVGVNWKVSLVGLKFIGANGFGTTADAIAAIDYATLMGFDILNNSWGGGGFSQALLDAINAAADAGILFVASAGNSGLDTDLFPHFPSNYDAPNVVSVAATDHNDNRAGFSNFGAQTVDLGAPGVAVVSTLPGNLLGPNSGTSMAAPHVSGAAALIRSVVPGIGVVELKELILNNTDPVATLAGITVTGGRLNAFRPIAVQDEIEPGSIDDLTLVTPTSNTVILQWTATGDDADQGTASSYDLRFSTGPIDVFSFHNAAQASGMPTPQPAGMVETAEVQGLDADTVYHFAIRALDEWGNAGPISNVVSTATLPPPTFASSPPAFDLTLFVGEIVNDTLLLQNTGVGTLDWSIPVPDISGPLAGEQQTPMYLEKDEVDPRVGEPVPETSGGPDIFGYAFITSDAPEGPSSSWDNVAVGGAAVLSLNGDDQISEPIAIGFDFPFYGRKYDTVFVGTNGWLSFDSTSTAHTNQPLPTAAGPRTLIAPFWDDLDFDGAYRVVYASDETRFTVQFIDVSRYSGPGSYTFQATLHRSGNLTFSYLSMTGDVANATIGIQSGGMAFELAFNTNLVHDGLTIEMTAGSQWFSVSPTEGRLFAGQGEPVTLTFDTIGLAPGLYSSSIDVETNDPTQPLVGHPVSVEVIGAPAIQLDPAALDFGEVPIGAAVTLPIEVKSVGTEPLNVSDITVGNSDLVVSPISFSLPPNASLTLDVTYTPTAIGPLGALLTIFSDVPNSPALDVPLVGLAVPPAAITVAPAAFSETLLTGQQVTRNLQLHNPGGSDLVVALTFDPPVPAQLAIPNGGFETGDFSAWTATDNGLPGLTAWTVSGAGGGWFGTSNPFEGSLDALNGFDGNAGLEYTLSRDIDLPQGARELVFYDRIQFDSLGISSTLPRIYEATLQDVSGNPLAQIVRAEILLHGMGYTDLGWQRRSVSLVPFAGQTVRLHIREFIPESLTGPALIEFDGFEIETDGFPGWLELSPTSVVVPPGATESIDVTFDASHSGDAYFEGSIRLDTNVPSTPTLLVPVDLTVVGAPDIAVGGGSVDLQSVEDYFVSEAVTTHQLSVAVPPVGGATLELIADGDYGLSSETATVTVEGLELGFVGNAGTDCTSVSGTFVIGAADLTSLVADGVVEVEVRNSAQVNPICAVNRHTVQLSYGSATDVLDFGAIFAGASTTLAIEIVNKGSAALVGSVASTAPEFTPSMGTLNLAPGAMTTLTVTFAPASAGSFAGTLSITSNDPDTPLISIPLTGTAQEPPIIDVSPSLLSSMLLTGEQETQVLTVSNTGGSPLEFSVSGQSLVSVAPLSGTVAAGSSLSVDVQFDATNLSGGLYVAELLITSNDPLTPVVTVPLALDVTGAPDIAVLGENVVVESVQTYVGSGTATMHSLAVTVPPGGSGSLELIANGDYGLSSETATMTVEGLTLGPVGGIGPDCAPASGTFAISPPDLQALAADGVVSVVVQNTADVNDFCEENSHTVRLSFRRPADELDFGTQVVGSSTTVTFEIFNSGTDFLEVASIVSDAAEFVPSVNVLSVAPGSAAPVSVAFVPSGVGSFTGTLSITSDDPDTPLVQIALTGTATDPPEIDVTPPSLSTTLPSGGQDARILTVSNSGGAPLEFSISSSVGFGHKVAVLGSPSGGDAWNLDVQQKLAATGLFSQVDTFRIDLTTPSLADLEAYDSVLVYTDRSPIQSAQLGNNLADYIDRGGGVVMAVFANAGVPLGGRFSTDDYWGIRPGSKVTGRVTLGVVYDLASPLLTGVSALDGGSSSFRGNGEVHPEATRVADWSNGLPLVVTRTIGSATRVDLNLFPPSTDVRSDFWVASTDGARLMANALVVTSELGFADVETSGTVAPGNSLEVDVLFDAAGLPGGVYQGDLRVHSNDPVTPLVTVPLTLEVIGAPNIVVSGESVLVESVQTYTGSGASTAHSLPVTISPTGGGILELIADGDYGSSNETATLTVEGATLGTVGGIGLNCSPASTSFSLGAAEVQALVADGVVTATVQNSSAVDSSCATNSHTVRLSYEGPADALDFGTLFVGSTAALSIEIANTGTDLLEVDSIASDLPQFSPSVNVLTVAPGSSASVVVTFAPASVGSFAGTLSISSNDPDTPLISIPLTGTGQGTPAIDVSPSSLSSMLLSGEQETQVLTVSNTGGGPLDFSIGGIVLGGAEPELEALSSSPARMTCVASDPQSGLLYGQANAGTSFYVYEAASDSWSPLANSPLSSGNNCGAALLGGKIYTSSATNSSSLGVYDIATDSWTTMVHPLGTGTGNIASDGQSLLYLVVGSTLRSFNPATSSVSALSAPPFSFSVWGGLSHFGGVLYGHQGNGGSSFASYDIGLDQWTLRPSLPGGAVLGSTIDPFRREYVCYGSYSQQNLYRYSIDGSVWDVITIPFFSVNDGGMDWLSFPATGIYFVQGETGTGFARLPGGVSFASVDPLSGTVAAGSSLDVDVLFDATNLSGGLYEAELFFTSNDPLTPVVTVPLALDVTGAPDIAVLGENVVVESVQTYVGSGAATMHSLAVTVPPAGGGSLELIANGDYGSGGETATMTVEGLTLGPVGGIGPDCVPASEAFAIDPPDLQALAADGVVSVVVQNTAGVNDFCAENSHTVRLSFRRPAGELDFGTQFVGSSTTVTFDILNNGTDSLEVASIVSDAAEFVPSVNVLSIVPGSVAPVSVTFVSSGVGSFTGTLSITSDDPDTPLVQIALTGTATEPPEINVTPPSLSTTLPSGGQDARILTVSNSGGAPLEFSISSSVGVGHKVAVLGSPSGGDAWNLDVQQKLAATGLFSQVDTFRIDLTTPSLADLEAYDSVLVYTDRAPIQSAQLGNNLADYVDLGGGVVMAVFADASVPPGGRFSTDNYWGIQPASQTQGRVSLGVVHDASSPLMTGVATLDGGSSSYRGTGAVHPEATRVADWSDGRPLVVTRTIGSATRVDLNFFPPSTDVRSDFWVASTDGARLMANALVVTGGLGWVDVQTSGTVAPGDNLEVDVLFDAAGLPGGVYQGDLKIHSNDPVTPLVTVPLTLEVIGAPNIVVSGALDFGTLFVGSTAVLSIEIANTGTDLLEVDTIASDLPQFAPSVNVLTVAPGSSASVVVTFAPATAGSFAGTLSITSNDPDTPSISIPLTGTAQEAPTIGVSPAAIDVVLPEGGQLSRFLTVSNVGNGPLDFAVAVLPSTATFVTVEPDQGNVPSSGSLSVNVGLNALGLAVGLHTADVLISSNDPATPSVTIPVSLTVIGSPVLRIGGAPIALESSQDYQSSGAATMHSLSIVEPPATDGIVELIANGDYGFGSETATLTAEGMSLGTIGSNGTDCTPVSGSFAVTANDLQALVADGIVDFQVQNSIGVDVFCAVNNHTVRLTYSIGVDQLDFGEVLLGASKEATVVVSNLGSAVLEVSAISTSDPAFVPTPQLLSLAPGTAQDVTIRFSPSVAASVSGTLTFTSNDLARPIVSLPLSGVGVEPPIAGVSPAALSSTLFEGDQEVQTLTISNSGGSALEFSLSVLPPNTVSVEFDGLSAGNAAESPTGGAGFYAGLDAVYQLLSPSPEPLACVVGDPGAESIYAQAYSGNAFYRYVSSTNVWESLSDSPLGAGGGCGAALLNGRVYSAYPQDGSVLGVYDIATDSWSTIGNPLNLGTANITGDGQRQLYLVGGGSFVRVDPETSSAVALAEPPFDFGSKAGLRHLEGVLYGHQGDGEMGFASYDIDADAWTVQASLPAGAVLGAAIDPIARQYVTAGPHGGRNLYRYGLDSGIWGVATIPFASVHDGGLGWLPGAFPGIYLVQGRQGTQLARALASTSAFTLLGTDANSGNLYTIDTLSAAAVPIGNMGFPAPSLAADPTTGILYAGRGGGSPWLYSIDPETAQGTFIGDTGLGFASIAGLDFDTGGTLYASANAIDGGGTGGDVLALIDKNTGQGVVVGLFGGGIGLFGGPRGIEAIAFDPSGTLYGTSGVQNNTVGDPSLYTIDTVSGAATLIGPIVDGAGAPVPGGVVSLQFAPDGTLYGGTGQGTGDLVQIDPASGTFTFIGHSVGNSLGGLAVVREPGDTSFLGLDPISGSVPPLASLDVDVLFDAANRLPGFFEAIVVVQSNDAANPRIEVPTDLTVVGIPDIALAAQVVTVESQKQYASSGVSTVHDLPVPSAAALEASVQLIAEGDYGVVSETATISAEGVALGTVGGVGLDCAAATGTFTIDAVDFAVLAADGVVQFDVQNSAQVDTSFCAANRHTVRLTVVAPHPPLDFGTIFVGETASLPLTIENRGHGDLEISAISSTLTNVSVAPGTLTVPPEATVEVTVTYAPTAAGPLTGSLEIHSNDMDEPVVIVDLLGGGLEPPVAEVNPTAIDSTSPPRSSTIVVETIALSNSGGSDLHWSATVFELPPPGPPAAEWVEQPKGYEADNGAGVLLEDAGGPDGFGYAFKDSDESDGPLFEWVDISGIGTLVPLTGDDQNSGPIPIGFQFPFYADSFDGLRICTNGWLSFTSPKTTYSNPDTLPNVGFAVPENLIAPFWDDLDLAGAEGIHRYSDGTRFIVQYSGVSRFSSPADLTFQVILYPNGRIVFQYLSMSGVLDSATIGIQNADKTIGLPVSYNEDYVHNGLAVEIVPLADWISAPTTFGVVAPGELTDIELELTSAELDQARYDAMVHLATNDPNNSMIQVPVSFLVDHLPIADAGVDADVECTSFSGATVLLDASASVDLDSTAGTNDDIVLFEWFDDEEMQTDDLLGTGETLEVPFVLGAHSLVLRVTDSLGATAIDPITVTIVDTTPPAIAVDVQPQTLWPPNHRMISVVATVTASDICDRPTVVLQSVVSDEPDNAPGTGDGNTDDDVQDAGIGTADFELLLRAERAGTGDGRTYTLVYTATDSSGNTTTDTDFVVVPHNKGGSTDPVEIFVEQHAGGTRVLWSEVPGAQFYNIIRGTVGHIAETKGAIDLGTVSCIETGSVDVTTEGSEDPEIPSPGEVFFYVVEYDDGVTKSSYGIESAPKPRVAGLPDCQ